MVVQRSPTPQISRVSLDREAGHVMACRATYPCACHGVGIHVFRMIKSSNDPD